MMVSRNSDWGALASILVAGVGKMKQMLADL